jgi:hypothetical protein
MSENNTGTPSPIEAAAPQADSSSESQESEGQVEAGSQDGASEEVAADAADTLADPKATKKEKEVAKKMLKKLKIKFNGKEIEEDLPFEIPDDEASVDYMRKQLQMSKMASSKSSEKAQLEKELQAFFQELKKNPRKVLSDPNIGVDMKKIVAEMIEEEISNSQKTPEQIEREKLENELRTLKEEREAAKEEQRQKELAHLQEVEMQRYDNMMTDALAKHTDLPKSPYIVKKMADYMLLGLQNDVELTAEDVIPLVREEMQDDLKQMFAVMPEDVIESIVGKETINKIRKKNIAKAKAGPVPATPAAKNGIDTGVSAKSEKAPAKKQSFRDFFGT